jgi:hypothetical protein
MKILCPNDHLELNERIFTFRAIKMDLDRLTGPKVSLAEKLALMVHYVIHHLLIFWLNCLFFVGILRRFSSYFCFLQSKL